MVYIWVFREPGDHAGGIEGPLDRLFVFPAMAAYLNGAVGAVEVVADVQVVFDLAEIGQHLDEGPLVVPQRRPTVEVFGEAANEGLAVDGAGAADNLASGYRRPLGVAGRQLARVGPVEGGVFGRCGGAESVAELIGQVCWVGKVGARFQQQHRPVGVVGKSCCKGAA